MLSRRLRILATAFGPVPGAGSHSAALMAMAGGLRAELDMITLKAEGLAYQGRIGEARLFRVRVGGTPDERREAFGRAVRRQLEAQPYDVVHTRGPFDGSVVASLADELGYRFVYEVATFPDEAEGGQAELEWEQRHLYCLERAELILVQTEAAARHLGDRGFAGKVAVVPPGVDVNGFDWWPSLPNDPPRLIYLGGCGADRDLATLLSAIRALRRRRRLQVLIAGEPRPEARQRTERLVSAFELDSCVLVRGSPADVSIPALIAAADIAVVPAAATPRFQEYGDLPEPILAYMACRRPLVAAAVPAVSEVVRDEIEGLLYLPGDEDSLAEAIETMSGDAPTRKRLVDAAYERVRQDFSSGARRRRMAEVFELLAPGSQSFDAWTEAFERDTGSSFSVPSSLMPMAPETQEHTDLSEPSTRADPLAPLETSPDHADSERERRDTMPAIPLSPDDP